MLAYVGINYIRSSEKYHTYIYHLICRSLKIYLYKLDLIYSNLMILVALSPAASCGTRRVRS